MDNRTKPSIAAWQLALKACCVLLAAGCTAKLRIGGLYLDVD